MLVNGFGFESSFVSKSDKCSLFSLSGTESIHHVPHPVPGTVTTHLEGPACSKVLCQLGEDTDNPDAGNPSAVWVWGCACPHRSLPTPGRAAAGKEHFLEERMPGSKEKVRKDVSNEGITNRKSLN